LTLVLGLLAVGAVSFLRPAERRESEVESLDETRPFPAVPRRDSPRRPSLPDAATYSPRLLWAVLRQAASDWSSHKDSRLGAALAYYSIFSLGPLTLIVVAVAGLVFGQDAVRGEVTSQLTGLLGAEGAKSIEAMLAGAAKPREGMVATLIGVATLIFAAIGVVVQLKDALNTVWEVEPSKLGGVWGFVRTYALSLAGVLALGFLLMVSLVISAAVAAIGSTLAPYIPEALFQVVTSAVSFAVIAVMFAMMFKWLPDAEVRWRDVWLGGLVTAALFEIGKIAIGLYIGKQGLESTFGAAGSIVVVLVWVYYSAQIVLFGAEFTHVHSQRSTRGGRSR
jgi:membrane protein